MAKSILILSTSSAFQEAIEQCREADYPCQTAGDSATAQALLADRGIGLVLVDNIALPELFPDIPVLTLQKPVRLESLFIALRSYFSTETLPVLLSGLYFFPREKTLASTSEAEEGEKLKLTEKEAAMLHFLYQHQGQAVDRESLLLGVWGYSAAMDTHTLETHVYRLRQKISAFFHGKEIILTSEGGYRLA